VVVSKEYPPEYVYYNVPNPWLQTRALRLLQFFPEPRDASVKASLREVLVKILNTTEPAKSVNRNNAAHSILFEAINLIIHYESDRELLVQAATMLGKFLGTREANIRYLGLETMARLAVVLEDTGEQMRRHQSTIFAALREPDISIRKQALNMLYNMCDRTNAQEVVAELLDYLNNAEYAMREELVLKIAILAEKFASDLSWYASVLFLFAVFPDLAIACRLHFFSFSFSSV
jgi:AP-2 complex subunit alpha